MCQVRGANLGNLETLLMGTTLRTLSSGYPSSRLSHQRKPVLFQHLRAEHHSSMFCNPRSPCFVNERGIRSSSVLPPRSSCTSQNRMIADRPFWTGYSTMAVNERLSEEEQYRHQISLALAR